MDNIKFSMYCTTALYPNIDQEIEESNDVITPKKNHQYHKGDRVIHHTGFYGNEMWHENVWWAQDIKAIVIAGRVADNKCLIEYKNRTRVLAAKDELELFDGDDTSWNAPDFDEE